MQASEAISQAEEWKNQAEKSEIQIQKLLSEKQELVSTVAEQGKRIAEQTEQIEKLNEADNVLKLNAELKKQNEKLKQDKLNAEQEAEATVSSVKREYEAKGRELDRRIGEAAKQSASLKSERQSISEDIEQRATAKYLDQKKELDRKFKAQTASYDSFLLGLLLYGVLTTVFTAVRSEAFVSDFKTFFMVIWQFIVNAFQLLLKGGQWASQLGDKIPQPVVATIVHYLLLIVFVGGIAIGVGFLILDLAFTVGPQTFLQVNTPQTPVLYEKALDAADVQPGDQILDLYCGVGTITLAAARRAGPHGRALGVERVEASIVCARENAARNSIPQAAFAAEPTETFLSAALKEGFPDGFEPTKIIVDPAYQGMAGGAAKALADLFSLPNSPKRLAYVSCNPKSFARDAKELAAAGLTLESISPVDLFPGAMHLELVAAFSSKKTLSAA